MSNLNAGLLAKAILSYAGPTDDPRIGSMGKSSPDVFKCERCGAENLDCSKIEHKADCPAMEMIAALDHIKTFIGWPAQIMVSGENGPQSIYLNHADAEKEAHIIKCVNCHDELLEALNYAASVLSGDNMSKSGLIRALEKARAAIAKATGEQQ